MLISGPFITNMLICWLGEPNFGEHPTMNRAQAFVEWAKRTGMAWLSALIVAAFVWGAWCLFSVSGEGRAVLMTVVGGVSGSCVGGLSLRTGRLVSNSIFGTCVSLFLYHGVRGFILGAVAPPASVQACGVTALAFLAALSRSAASGRSEINVLAARAVVLLMGMFAILGLVASPASSPVCGVVALAFLAVVTKLRPLVNPG